MTRNGFAIYLRYLNIVYIEKVYSQIYNFFNRWKEKLNICSFIAQIHLINRVYMAIAIFFTGHWFSSLFSQTFFLHRYSAHHMFEMNKFWERFFHIFTFISQGSSYLNARAYAILHRLHHVHSDTKNDPHSPVFYKSVFGLSLIHI